MRAIGDATNQDSKFNLIFESKWTVKIIIESVMDILALFKGKDSAELITKQFLQSLEENLDLFKQELIIIPAILELCFLLWDQPSAVCLLSKQ